MKYTNLNDHISFSECLRKFDRLIRLSNVPVILFRTEDTPLTHVLPDSEGASCNDWRVYYYKYSSRYFTWRYL